MQSSFFNEPRFLPVTSVNYDYLPMLLESPKTLWVDLFEPAPKDLKIGEGVFIHMNANSGIEKKPFRVDDIVGSRVILVPAGLTLSSFENTRMNNVGKLWLPTQHEPCDSPFGWGYSTATIDSKYLLTNNKYGYGAPRAYLIY